MGGRWLKGRSTEWSFVTVAWWWVMYWRVYHATLLAKTCSNDQWRKTWQLTWNCGTNEDMNESALSLSLAISLSPSPSHCVIVCVCARTHARGATRVRVCVCVCFHKIKLVNQHNEIQITIINFKPDLINKIKTNNYRLQFEFQKHLALTDLRQFTRA